MGMMDLPGEDGIGGLIQLLIAALIIGGAILESVLRKRAARNQEGQEVEEEETAPDVEGEEEEEEEGEEVNSEWAESIPQEQAEEPEPAPLRDVPRPVQPTAPPPGPRMPAFRLVEKSDAGKRSPPSRTIPGFVAAPALSIDERLYRLGHRSLTPNQRAFVLTQVFGPPRHSRLVREGMRGLIHRV